MSEDSERKYSSQTVEVLTLFQRFGRSSLGLLLLELGWVLILVLVSKITGEAAGVRGEVPRVPEVAGIRLTTIWLSGALLGLIGTRPVEFV